MSDIEKMRARVFDIIDPNIDYTQDDFNQEFSVKTTSFNGWSDGKLNLSFVNKSDNPDPEYATDGSSGFDVRADLGGKSIDILGGGIAIVPTGLYFDIPDNFEIEIRPRSGIAAKNGVTVLNSPGTCDQDYTGEVKIILINHSKETFVINHGDRIAQGTGVARDCLGARAPVPFRTPWARR